MTEKDDFTAVAFEGTQTVALFIILLGRIPSGIAINLGWNCQMYWRVTLRDQWLEGRDRRRWEVAYSALADYLPPDVLRMLDSYTTLEIITEVVAGLYDSWQEPESAAWIRKIGTLQGVPESLGIAHELGEVIAIEQCRIARICKELKIAPEELFGECTELCQKI